MQPVLEGRVGLADHRAYPDVGGCPDGAVGDELPCPEQGRVVPEALADPEDDPGRFGRLGHGPGVVHRVGDGLLARDVLAGRNRGEDVVLVEVGGGEDLDGVDVGVGQQLLEGGVGPGAAPFGCGLCGPTGHRIAHGDHVAARVGEVAANVEDGDVARADDADPGASVRH